MVAGILPPSRIVLVLVVELALGRSTADDEYEYDDEHDSHPSCNHQP